MTEKGEIYKCEICGNIAEVLHPGMGELVCCGQPMKKMQANTVDASKEKHVPVTEKTDTGTRVRVGTEPHPMETGHFIEWIELKANGTVYRKELEPGQKPEAEFPTKAENAEARAYCNLHGLWKG